MIDEWINRSGLAVDMMAHFDLGDAVRLDYSLDSLRSVTAMARRRFPEPTDMLRPGRQPEMEGLVAYLGETLIRLARGHWQWDDGPQSAYRWRFDDVESAGVPVVQPNEALPLTAVSPLHVLLQGGEHSVAVFEEWQRAVHEHRTRHPEWDTVTEPTLTDGMPIMPPSPILDAWLAAQSRDFPRWADTYGGTWDYTPDTADDLAALVFRLTPTVAEFEDVANSHFAEGASWYFGEMLCRAYPARWTYRAHAREPGDPLPVCFSVHTNDNADFTTPFIRLSNALRYGDPGRLRRGYHVWAENAPPQ